MRYGRSRGRDSARKTPDACGLATGPAPPGVQLVATAGTGPAVRGFDGFFACTCLDVVSRQEGEGGVDGSRHMRPRVWNLGSEVFLIAQAERE